MDNSLQEIAGSFTFLGMNKSWLSKVFIALLPATLAVPLAAQADSNCVGSECEVVYDFTSEGQVFDVPQGAKNIRFQIYGASGGRGAAGGLVSGTIINPPETLYIYVGGAGRMGAGAQGGFNGGGGSGGNSGTEGSGGGASDIRLSQALDSRIAVAGGGGGGGGEAGGSGGQGGDTFGGNGVSGQASGGSGGTPDRGGTAGASNGGFSSATAGSFGQGGRGGYSSFGGVVGVYSSTRLYGDYGGLLILLAATLGIFQLGLERIGLEVKAFEFAGGVAIGFKQTAVTAPRPWLQDLGQAHRHSRAWR